MTIEIEKHYEEEVIKTFCKQEQLEVINAENGIYEMSDFTKINIEDAIFHLATGQPKGRYKEFSDFVKRTSIDINYKNYF